MDKQNRIEELESIAKNRFIENSDWHAVLEMLNKEEKEELETLKQKTVI